ncbi:MAG: CofH family radical SAM protein [Archaeoglobaceae archaeon]|nr:CofH family radical SAM protein [Archaeoglobaceae archaeon]
MSVKEIEDLFKLDLHELGSLIKKEEIVTFSINAHINYSNICETRCKICAYHRQEGFTLPVDEVVKEAVIADKKGAKELHIVGSHNPELGIEYFEEIFRKISSKCSATIKALTAAEVSYYSKKDKISVREFLSRLKKAGLRVLAGGGAEILVNSVRKKICPKKCKSEEWLRIMKIAHDNGIKSNATMLFGHIENLRHRAIHLYRLRKLQEKTSGFLAFVPLPFHPEGTEFKSKPSTVDILKTIAVSRLTLPNFRGIKAYWVMLGLELAEIALHYGANDLDGTVGKEKIAHSAGAKTPTGLNMGEILRLIKNAEKIPAERDAFFNILRIYEDRKIWVC